MHWKSKHTFSSLWQCFKHHLVKSYLFIEHVIFFASRGSNNYKLKMGFYLWNTTFWYEHSFQVMRSEFRHTRLSFSQCAQRQPKAIRLCTEWRMDEPTCEDHVKCQRSGWWMWRNDGCLGPRWFSKMHISEELFKSVQFTLKSQWLRELHIWKWRPTKTVLCDCVTTVCLMNTVNQEAIVVITWHVGMDYNYYNMIDIFELKT